MELKEQALLIRQEYRLGKISREEAKKRIKPFEEYFNQKSREIAKKYNQKPKLFNFNSFMR